jgi:hypothetical protein
MSKTPHISRFLRKLRSVVAVPLAISIPVAATAQTQLGTVTSTSPFELRGAHVNPAPGVPNWPVVSGDTLQAGNAPLTLTLFDGSTVIVAPRTRVTLGVMNNGPVVRLDSGSVHYNLRRDPGEINFYCRNDRSAITNQTGELDCGQKAAAWWWVPAAAGGGAAGAAAVAAALLNGPAVSPARCGGVGLPACP